MAGISSGATSGPKKARLEIIPLIDVIFFLLATFVLFTLSLNRSQGIHVDLPESETGVTRDPTGSATISVSADGTMAWDKDPVTLDVFLTRLKEFKLEHPEDTRILINADSDSTYSSVIYVMDEVRKARIDKVFIETRVHPKT